MKRKWVQVRIKQWLWCEWLSEDDEWLEKVRKDERKVKGVHWSWVLLCGLFNFDLRREREAKTRSVAFTFLFAYFPFSYLFLQIYFEPSHSQVNLNISITITDYRGAQSPRDREGAEQFQLLALTLAHSQIEGSVWSPRSMPRRR